MPTYICEECGCIDNSSSAGNYWAVECKLNLYKKDDANKKLLCVVCTPTEFSDGSRNDKAGKWHNYFPRKHWSEYGTKEELIKKCKQGQGNMVNAIEYFSKLRSLK